MPTPPHWVGEERESSSVHFLDEVLLLFRYPAKSWFALLAGILPLRYCLAGFDAETPSWRLPSNGACCGFGYARLWEGEVVAPGQVVGAWSAAAVAAS